MEITIRIDGKNVPVEVSVEVQEYLDEARRKEESLAHERRRHWDWREPEEYILAAERHLPYQESPEDTVCRKETRDEIASVLATCTAVQRERFLLYALYDFSYGEIGAMCGCSKEAVHQSIKAIRKKFLKSYTRYLDD